MPLSDDPSNPPSTEPVTIPEPVERVLVVAQAKLPLEVLQLPDGTFLVTLGDTSGTIDRAQAHAVGRVLLYDDKRSGIPPVVVASSAQGDLEDHRRGGVSA